MLLDSAFGYTIYFRVSLTIMNDLETSILITLIFRLEKMTPLGLQYSFSKF